LPAYLNLLKTVGEKMNNRQNKPVSKEEKNEVSRYPWEFMALMISLVVGVILIGLKIAGVF
jgi:hypothetical protein